MVEDRLPIAPERPEDAWLTESMATTYECMLRLLRRLRSRSLANVMKDKSLPTLNERELNASNDMLAIVGPGPDETPDQVILDMDLTMESII
jgi:hypothetical protein